jgi:hypothetical protein
MNNRQIFNQNPWLNRHLEAINTITHWSDVNPVVIFENLTRKYSTRQERFAKQNLRRAA